MSRIPLSTWVVGAVALGLGAALVYVLTRPPPVGPPGPARSTAEYIPMEPARPGDTNPIAAKVLAEGGPRTPSVATAGGLARGVAPLSFAWDPTAADAAWSCVEVAARHAAAFSTTDAPNCAGNGPARFEGSVVVTRQPAPTTKGVHRDAPNACRATLTSSTPNLRLSVGPIPAAGEDCAPIVAELRTALAEALAEKAAEKAEEQ
jgi:hypothetical protein